MTTEEFDDAIRQKFQARRSTFTQAEVDRVLKHVRSNRSRLAFLKWIRVIVLILLALTIAGFIFRYVKINNEKEELLKEIVELRSHAGKVKAEGKVEAGHVNDGKSSVGNIKTIPALINNLNSISKSINNKVPLNDPPPVTNQKQPLVPLPILPKDTTSSVAKERNDIQEIPLSPINIHPASYLLSISKLIQPNQQEGTEIRKNNHPKLNPGFATGIGFDLGTSFISYGLVEDISFLKRWSITTGIKSSVTYHEKFKDVNEYQKNTKEAFTHKYDPDGYNYSTWDITNIDIQTKSFQIPLFINYKIGLKNNFNLLLSAGTNFVISSSQNVKFNNLISGPISVLNTVSFVNHYIGPMFRDINIGVGLQYVRRKFSIDASPNLGVLINNPNNEKRFNWGVRVRVMCGI